MSSVPLSRYGQELVGQIVGIQRALDYLAIATIYQMWFIWLTHKLR